MTEANRPDQGCGHTKLYVDSFRGPERVEGCLWCRLDTQKAEVARLNALINTPETTDFIEGVKREAVHQRERWGAPHDREKSAEHWYWLVGYLAGKALRAAITGNADKARHHTISSAAALLHWHAAISQDETGTGAGRDADLRAHDDGRQAHETAPVSI